MKSLQFSHSTSWGILPMLHESTDASAARWCALQCAKMALRSTSFWWPRAQAVLDEAGPLFKSWDPTTLRAFLAKHEENRKRVSGGLWTLKLSGSFDTQPGSRNADILLGALFSLIESATVPSADVHRTTLTHLTNIGLSARNVLQDVPSGGAQNPVSAEGRVVECVKSERWPLTIPSAADVGSARPEIAVVWDRFCEIDANEISIGELIDARSHARNLGLDWRSPLERAVAERLSLKEDSEALEVLRIARNAAKKEAKRVRLP